MANLKINYRIIVCFITVISILAIIPISVSYFSYMISNTVLTESYSIKKGKDISESYGYDMKEDCKGVELNINLKLKEGKISFKLIDPEGNIQWEQTVNSSKEFNCTKSFEKVAGYWSLEFENVERLCEGELMFEFKKH